MKLRLTPRALAEAKQIKTWWGHHRPSAPGLFEQELKAALKRIRAAPDLGSAYQPDDFDVLVRRVLLPKTRHHVYYTVESMTIVVLSIWGAPKGRDPDL